MSTLEVNFEWENMSDTSMDDDDFENIDELSDPMPFNLPKNEGKLFQNGIKLDKKQFACTHLRDGPDYLERANQLKFKNDFALMAPAN